jgi:hypothetical protein
MEEVDSPDLGLGDTVGSAEIELDRRRFAAAFLHILENGIDFLLR